MTTHPSPLTPPPVTDRRAPDRRSLDQERPDRGNAVAVAAAAAIACCGGLAILFAFFAAIGTINFGNAIVATLVACALAAIWAGGVIYAHRHRDGAPDKRDRERRGF